MSLPILLFYGFSFIGIVHSVIFSFLAIKNKNKTDLIITFFLFAQAVIILEYVFYWTGINNPYHYLCNISLPLHFLFGPLLFTYVDYVFLEKKKPAVYVLHFIPALLIFVLMLPYFFSTTDLKLNHYKMIPFFILDMRLVVLCIMAHMSTYAVMIFIKIFKVKRVGHIKNWLLLLTSLFAFYIACYISYYIMVQFPWFNLTTDYFVSVGMCASIVSIIYVAYAKKKILEGYPFVEAINLENIYFAYKEKPAELNTDKKKEPTIVYNYPTTIDPVVVSKKVVVDQSAEPTKDIKVAKYKNSGLTMDAGNELAEALVKLMKSEKLYRESELKLETIAARLDVPKHYISQVINQHFEVNFFEYVNLLRIEEARQLLSTADKKAMNIIEIAYAVGYSTKNTFNVAFRRIVGVTPSEYRNQNLTRMN